MFDVCCHYDACRRIRRTKKLSQQYNTNYVVQTFSRYDEENAKKSVIKQYKEKAIVLLDNMIREVDRKSNSFSDLGATVFIDMILEAVLYFSIDSEYSSESKKPKQLNI